MSPLLLKNGLSSVDSQCFLRGLSSDFTAMPPETSTPWKASEKGTVPRSHFMNRWNNYDHLGEYSPV